MNVHWELILVIQMQFVQIPQEVIHVSVKLGIQELVLLVMVKIFEILNDQDFIFGFISILMLKK